MRIFIEFLQGLKPHKDGIEHIDNRQNMPTICVPDWAQPYSPIYENNGHYSINETENSKRVGRIYVDKVDFLKEVGRKKMSIRLVNSERALIAFEKALHECLLIS